MNVQKCKEHRGQVDKVVAVCFEQNPVKAIKLNKKTEREMTGTMNDCETELQEL